MRTSDLGYVELTLDEAVASLQGQALLWPPGWLEANACPKGTLRVLTSGLLPWTYKDGLEVHACAWPSGQILASKLLGDMLKGDM